MPDGLIDWDHRREQLCGMLMKSIGEYLGIDAERAGEMADEVLDTLERESLDHIRGAGMSLVRSDDGRGRLTMQVTFEFLLPER